MECFKCNGRVVWQNDFDTEDLGIEGEGMVSYYFCSECNTMYEAIQMFEAVENE